jgi:hypothetical protein
MKKLLLASILVYALTSAASAATLTFNNDSGLYVSPQYHFPPGAFIDFGSVTVYAPITTNICNGNLCLWPSIPFAVRAISAIHHGASTVSNSPPMAR